MGVIRELHTLWRPSCSEVLWSVFTHVASIYANLLEQKKAFA